MCIKASDTELASMKFLMALVLNVIIADVFGMKLKTINPELRLSEDLRMTAQQKQKLEQLIAEYFDGLALDCRPEMSLADIHARVVDAAFVRSKASLAKPD